VEAARRKQRRVAGFLMEARFEPEVLSSESARKGKGYGKKVAGCRMLLGWVQRRCPVGQKMGGYKPSPKCPDIGEKPEELRFLRRIRKMPKKRLVKNFTIKEPQHIFRAGQPIG
jgi:hypothetical protein